MWAQDLQLFAIYLSVFFASCAGSLIPATSHAALAPYPQVAFIADVILAIAGRLSSTRDLLELEKTYKK